MGAYNNDRVFSPMCSFASSQDFRLSKHVHDSVHGNIYLDAVTLSEAPIEFFTVPFASNFCTFFGACSCIFVYN